MEGDLGENFKQRKGKLGTSFWKYPCALGLGMEKTAGSVGEGRQTFRNLLPPSTGRRWLGLARAGGLHPICRGEHRCEHGKSSSRIPEPYVSAAPRLGSFTTAFWNGMHPCRLQKIDHPAGTGTGCPRADILSVLVCLSLLLLNWDAGGIWRILLSGKSSK